MATKAKNKKQKKKGKQLNNKQGQLLPLHKSIQDRFIAFAQLIRKEYGDLHTVYEGGVAKRRRDRDIPYGWPDFAKGTQDPVFRLRLQNTLINLTAATNYTTVYSLQAQFLQNFSDLANMFDEYRFIRGEFYIFLEAAFYHAPSAVTINAAFGGGYCIDYGSSAAIASLDAGRSHDTWKQMHFVLTPGLGEKPGAVHKWKVQFEKLTDEAWNPVATSNVSVCYFKPFIPGTAIPMSVTGAYSVYGAFDVQFRGQSF